MKNKNEEPKEFTAGLCAFIDAAKFKSDAPRLQAAQKELYCSYENNTTYEMLISRSSNVNITLLVR